MQNIQLQQLMAQLHKLQNEATQLSNVVQNILIQDMTYNPNNTFGRYHGGTSQGFYNNPAYQQQNPYGQPGYQQPIQTPWSNAKNMGSPMGQAQYKTQAGLSINASAAKVHSVEFLPRNTGGSDYSITIKILLINFASHDGLVKDITESMTVLTSDYIHNELSRIANQPLPNNNYSFVANNGVSVETWIATVREHFDGANPEYLKCIQLFDLTPEGTLIYIHDPRFRCTGVMDISALPKADIEMIYKLSKKLEFSEDN